MVSANELLLAKLDKVLPVIKVAKELVDVDDAVVTSNVVFEITLALKESVFFVM